MWRNVEKATEVEYVEKKVYWRKRRKWGKWGEVCVESGKSQKRKKGEKWCVVGGRGDGKKRGVVEPKRGKSTSPWGQEKSRGKSVRGQEKKVAGKVKGEILEKKTPHAGLEPATLSLEG